ncbi:MAG: DUF1858 domain-containing protein [Elusimicrobiota bacterium]
MMARDAESGKTITPDTKVAELLADFPELEEALMRLSPAFGKLRNPVLRRTVAKAATLRQVARVGDVPLPKLISCLREAAGLAPATIDCAVGRKDATPPPWFSPERIKETFDARPVIEAGQAPVQQVLARLDGLEAGDILELTTPFPPEPLIEQAGKKGFAAWTKVESPGLVKTCFVRRE